MANGWDPDRVRAAYADARKLVEAFGADAIDLGLCLLPAREWPAAGVPGRLALVVDVGLRPPPQVSLNHHELGRRGPAHDAITTAGNRSGCSYVSAAHFAAR
jgi:hypothetical protein